MTKREGQAGIDDRAAFTGRRMTDNHVPRQFVKRGFTSCLTYLGCLKGINCGEQIFAQGGDFGTRARARSQHGIIGLTTQDSFQNRACTVGQDFAYQ